MSSLVLLHQLQRQAEMCLSVQDADGEDEHDANEKIEQPEQSPTSAEVQQECPRSAEVQQDPRRRLEGQSLMNSNMESSALHTMLHCNAAQVPHTYCAFLALIISLDLGAALEAALAVELCTCLGSGICCLIQPACSADPSLCCYTFLQWSSHKEAPALQLETPKLSTTKAVY